MSKLKIHVIIGSTRQGRYADKPAHWIREILNEHEQLDAELVDLRDWPLPMFDQPKGPARVTDGDYGHPLANAWAKKVDEADGFIMMVVEYNHGYTAVLKNAIDWIYREWSRKPVSFVGYGNAGGSRAVEQLRQVAIELQMAPMKSAVHIPGHVYMATMKEAAPIDRKLYVAGEPAAHAMREDLVWWASALREARSRTTRPG